MPLTFTVLRCPDAVAPETRAITGGEFSVGRGPGVDWLLPDPERLLSKHHFAVAYRGGTWQIADTSTNGTFLNTETTPLGRGQLRALRDGDRLKLGAYEIEVRLAEESVQPAGGGMAFGAGPSAGASPFGDPFGADPFAPPAPPPTPFGEPAYSPASSLGSAQLPPDFDPLAPDAGEEPFHGPTQRDHSPLLEDAFQAPSVTGQMPLHTGGALPGDDLLPDDWDKDLLEGIAPSATPNAPPAARPAPRPPAPPAPQAYAPPREEPVRPPPQPAQPVVQPVPPAAPAAPPAPAARPAPPAPAAANPFDEPFDLGPEPAPPVAPPMAPAHPPSPSPYEAPYEASFEAPFEASFEAPFEAPFAAVPAPAAQAIPPVRPAPPAAPAPPVRSAPPAAPAAPVRPAPPAAPAPPPAAAPADAALLAAFLGGVGLADAHPADPVATMRALGQAFRATVAGLRAVLIARASVKSEFRIEQTMIQARGNNPLKFSAGDDDAVAALLGIGRRTDMTASAAIADALNDIKLHELASMAAMQSAVRALLDGLEPAKLRAQAEHGGLSLLPVQRKARAWDAYEALHGRTVQALSDDFDSLFGKAFARAYEQAMQDVSAKERR